MAAIDVSVGRRRLVVLGSTGSIGRSTLEVVRKNPDQLEVVALGARGSRPELLLEQVAEFEPQVVVVCDEAVGAELRPKLGERLRVGASELERAARLDGADVVVAAIVGAAGVASVAAALEAGKTVALANKESLVVAGVPLLETARRTGGVILPIDSEHVALHQGLRCGKPEEVLRLTLTASGGPFLDRARDSWAAITPSDAIDHPTWDMGAKISVDSATLMNKGLELIEASYLFDIEHARIDVVVHPQSLVHSFVEFKDGSTMAQLSTNDMAIPIQYALSYPERWNSPARPLRLSELGRLEFRPLDHERFPSIRLARAALDAGPGGPAVLNAANEVAVAAFLEGAIPFERIHQVVADAVERHAREKTTPVATVAEALAWDRWGRQAAESFLSGRA